MTRNALKKLGLLRVALVAGVGLPLIIATSARAQDPAAAAPAPAAPTAPEQTTERVIVTGSNIPTAEEVGANPVLTLNRDVIQKSGVRTTEELLQRVPVINANQIPTQNNGTSQSGPAGTSSIALRGLDVQATLVLVDGKRVAPFPGAAFVDLNNIPQPFIESIEILKQGASAVYGADAVAGVVNIKTWKDFRGVQATVEYGNVLDKNAARYMGDVLFGVGDDKTSINGDIFYYHHNSTFNQDYGNSAFPPFLSSNSSPWNVQVTKQAAVLAGGVAVGGASLNEFTSAPRVYSPNAANWNYAAGRIHTFNFNAYSSSFPEQERWGGYASFIHKVCDDQVQVYGDFMYNDSKTHDELAPIATGSFQTPGNPVIAIPPHMDLNGMVGGPGMEYAGAPTYAATGVDAHAYNPFNPFNQILSGGTRARIFDFGNRLIDNEAQSWLTTLGVKGDKLFDGSWGYDSFFRYSESDLTSRIVTAAGDRFAQILNANSDIYNPASSTYIGTTIPYNPFGSFRVPAISTNAPSINYARANIRDLSKSSVAEAGVNIYTTDLFDLPAGGVGFAFGGDWRREEYKFNPDDQNRIGNQLGVGVAPYAAGGRKAYSFYAETTIPIFSPSMGIWGLHNVEFDAAGRFEDFRNNNTNVLVPRLGLRWQPFDEQLTLRATWGEGYLEPSLSELYSPPFFTLAPTTWNGNAEPETTYEVTTNKNLKPGDSRDFTAGFVYTPKWMPSGQTLTFSADFWDIERTGVVTQPSAQEVVNRFRHGALEPGEIVQLSGPPNDPNTSVNFVKSGFLNSGKQKSRGVDLTLLYQYQTPNWGTFTWTTSATYLDSFIFQLDTSSTPHEVSGRANNDPFEGAFFGQVTAGDGWLKWKGVSTLDWAWRNFDFTFTEHYWDGFKEEWYPEALRGKFFFNPAWPERDHYVSQTWFSDIQASYTLIFTPPVESQPVAGYSKDGKEVMTGKGKEVETVAYEMPCWKTILNNSTLSFGVTNVFGQDPPNMYGFLYSNANNYPGSLYDNLGRFYYLRLTKKF